MCAFFVGAFILSRVVRASWIYGLVSDMNLRKMSFFWYFHRVCYTSDARPPVLGYSVLAASVLALSAAGSRRPLAARAQALSLRAQAPCELGKGSASFLSLALASGPL